MKPLPKFFMRSPRILVLFVFGLAYVMMTPIFEAPDEPAHFARAYGIAEGQLVLKDHPKALVLFILHNYESHHALERGSAAGYLKRFEHEPEQARIPNIAFNSSLYSPVPYVFHAAVIKAVMLLSASDPALWLSVYLCRVLSLFLFCLGLGAAFSICPQLSWPIFWVAATPMALSQASIVSTDPIIFCSCILILCLATGKTPIKFYATALILCSTLLMLSKPPYIPVLALPVCAYFFNRSCQERYKGMVIAVAIGVSISGMLIWNIILKQYEIFQKSLQFIQMFVEMDIDPLRQLSGALKNPLTFVEVVWNTIILTGPSLFHQMVGVLGGLDIPIPFWVVFSWGILFWIPIVISGQSNLIQSSSSNWMGGICVVVSVLTSLSVMLSAYIIWMPVGSATINLQGRYFHAITAILFAGIAILKPSRIVFRSNCSRIAEYGLLLAVVVIQSVALATLYSRYNH